MHAIYKAQTVLDESKEAAVKNEGAIELIIRGIEKHIGNAELCKVGCAALKAVTLRTGNKAVIYNRKKIMCCNALR